MNARFSAAPACALILAGAMPLSVCAQNSPSFTEMASPEGNQSFGWAFDALPDLTQDGAAEFHVRDTRRLYVYDGASLNQLFAFDSAYCDSDFVTRTADSAGDLTGDGVPDLLFGQECAGRLGQVIVVNGKTGEELFRLDSPEGIGFFGHTVHLLPDVTGDGKPDWLIHEREGGIQTAPGASLFSRAYVFNSQTREVVKTLWNEEAEYAFNMEFVTVIPDVDGDRIPELLTTARFTPVRRNGQTINNAGRALVRSLGTGKVLYELHDPEPVTNGRFGLQGLAGIGDVDGDGVGDIAIGSPLKDNGAGGVYLFSGADGKWFRTLRSPNSVLGFFGGRIEVLSDLNADGVPELCVQQNGAWLIHIFDGLSSKLLKSIKYPGPAQGNPLGGPRFTFRTLRQDPPLGIRAYLFAAPYVANYAGRAYYMPFTPLTPPKPLRLKPLGASETGFRLQVIGDPGSKAELQSTSDLSAWESVASVTLGDQPFELEDPAPANEAQRFYRAIQK